jgi:hypothetical protein
MRAVILTGTKSEIAASIANATGQVREVIMFVEETAPDPRDARSAAASDIFAEVENIMVDVENVDDSRQSIYTRMSGE